MIDREKVIEGLEWMAESYIGLVSDISKDALALLKAQEPRVMTLEEVKVADYAWLESQNGHLFVPVLIVPGKANIVIVTIYGTALLKEADYNMQWRCWTSCPTDEQREATPWVKT